MSRTANSQKIRSAFLKMRNNERNNIETLMGLTMKDSMSRAIENHDGFHPYHIDTGGDYCWALTHDGTLVDNDVYRTDDMSGDAEKYIPAYVNNAIKEGWEGILIAGMEPYELSERYEVNVLTEVSDYVRKMVHNTFKNLKLV